MSRSNKREPSGLTMTCRASKGGSIELEVLDLSLAGCMVDRRSWSGRPGERILARLPGLAPPQPATIVWVEGDRGSISFEKLLYEAVFNHLQCSIAPPSAQVEATAAR